ncbi:hypothetical protein C8Q76DRAFT_803612 [Earliella scabrosa]|nr:hypothetical protein C8Q76DRAFT_803612 [Earliella scabrosa]
MALEGMSTDDAGHAKREMQQRHERLFELFLQHPNAFRNLMWEKCAILGGSAALSLVNDTFPTVTNIDVYVPLDHLDSLVEHLTTEEGYKVVAQQLTPHQPTNATSYCGQPIHDYAAGVAHMVTLSRDTTTVDIMGSGFFSTTDSPTVPLAYQWTTLLMNFDESPPMVTIDEFTN